MQGSSWIIGSIMAYCRILEARSVRVRVSLNFRCFQPKVPKGSFILVQLVLVGSPRIWLISWLMISSPRADGLIGSPRIWFISRFMICSPRIDGCSKLWFNLVSSRGSRP